MLVTQHNKKYIKNGIKAIFSNDLEIDVLND